MKKTGRKPKPRLSIAIDCGSLSFLDPKYYGGISTIAMTLIEELARLDKRNRYLLYSFSPIERSFLRKLREGMQNIVLPRWGYKTVWLPIHLQVAKPDVFLALSQTVAYGSPATLGFVYDLAFLRHADAYRDSARLKKITDVLIDKSRHIVTTSEASRSDIIKFYKLTEKEVSVCYPGVEVIYKPDGLKYIDTKPYFLYVGSLRAAKNIPTLVKAFSQTRKTTKKDIRLLLVGSDNDLDPAIKTTISQEKLHKHVHLKGFVKTQDLPKYYRGAISLVSVSLFEGFGLPILEAMSCGCPVIVGKSGAPPEVVGRAGIVADETNPEEISEAMVKCLDEKGRIKLKKAVLKQAKIFSSRRFAKQILDLVYTDCMTHEH